MPSSAATIQRAPGCIAHLHAFRGFAIISIVLGHCLAGIAYFSGGPSVSSSAQLFYSVVETFGHGGILYFVLISGLLFSLVLESRGYRSFFISKLKNVVLPYILMSFLYTLFTVYGGPENDVSVFNLLTISLKNIYMGTAFFHMWYVPVLILLYLTTPLLAKIVASPKLRWLMVVLFLLPLVFSRVWPGFSFSRQYISSVLTVPVFLSEFTMIKA
ncbi:MAG: surface polysaccharide O-acyltransferase-like enzyme [Flavobacteriales bacterium]|jgi:surface polysaccharide O-acyltransferase-like enzyme